MVNCGRSNSTDSKVSNQSQFEWDFSEQKKYVYSYTQTSISENKMGKDRSIDKNKMEGIGFLNVRIKENNLSDISLTDIKMKITMFNEDSTPKDTNSQELPPVVAQDMKPDGSFESSNGNILFDYLFPLPNKKLEKGDFAEIPMQMPFNANGSMLSVKGQNTLNFVDYKELKGRNCAVLKGEIDISKLDTPRELKGNYQCTTTGNATYYFDLDNGCFVESDINMDIHIVMDTETPENENSGMYMEIKSHDTYKIRLENIVE